jgi:hypothetical protein
VALAAGAIAALPQTARADEATGKVVWVDQKNNSLLLECIDKGCPKIPSAKSGETFTFVIPANMKTAVGALKEGQQVTVTYQTAQSGGYSLVGVK